MGRGGGGGGGGGECDNVADRRGYSAPDSSPETEGGEGLEGEAATGADGTRTRVEELEDERTEMMNRLTRARADLTNLKRRSEQ